jgi:hypothetical protein
MSTSAGCVGAEFASFVLNLNTSRHAFFSVPMPNGSSRQVKDSTAIMDCTIGSTVSIRATAAKHWVYRPPGPPGGEVKNDGLSETKWAESDTSTERASRDYIAQNDQSDGSKARQIEQNGRFRSVQTRSEPIHPSPSWQRDIKSLIPRTGAILAEIGERRCDTGPP